MDASLSLQLTLLFPPVFSLSLLLLLSFPYLAPHEVAFDQSEREEREMAALIEQTLRDEEEGERKSGNAG